MTRVLVREILVNQYALDASENWALMETNSEYIERVRATGLFEDDELPPDSVALSYLLEYVGQVNNGGHEQYVANCGWKNTSLDFIACALDRIGALHQLALFREVRAYIDADEERRKGMASRGGFSDLGYGTIDKWVTEKDCAFYKLNKENDIYSLGGDYLRRHPDLHVVPNDDWLNKIAELAGKNPHLNERRHEIEKRDLAGRQAYERKLQACVALSEMIGAKIDATRGVFTKAKSEAGDFEAVIHRTDKETRVAYFERQGRAVVVSYPSGELLAEVEL